MEDAELKVEFHNIEPNGIDMSIVIIVSRYKGKWILVKHKERNTYEILPGILNPVNILHLLPEENFTRKPELPTFPLSSYLITQ